MSFAFNTLAHEGAAQSKSREAELPMNSDVDLNLINPGEFDAWMQGGLTKTSPTNLPEGHFTVLAHGAGGVVVYDHRPITEGTYEIATLQGTHRRIHSRALDGDDLASMLTKRFPELRTGHTVVLASCFTGGAPAAGYRTNIAQHVANKLGVTVISPTGRLTLSQGNVVSIVNLDGAQGAWKTFQPQGR